mgnify:CR=1 FL=1
MSNECKVNTDPPKTDISLILSEEILELKVCIEALRAENSTQFAAGAGAMFDKLYSYAANHWHVGLETDTIYRKENALLVLEWAKDALEQVSPEAHTIWNRLDEVLKEVHRLRTENAKLQNPQKIL